MPSGGERKGSMVRILNRALWRNYSKKHNRTRSKAGNSIESVKCKHLRCVILPAHCSKANGTLKKNSGSLLVATSALCSRRLSQQAPKPQ